MVGIVTWQNAHTGEQVSVCAQHEDLLLGAWSVTYGQHDGICLYCAAEDEEDMEEEWLK